MIKFGETEIIGFDAAIRGMRNPMNSWDRSDTTKELYCREGAFIYDNPVFKIGPNDLDLMMRLAKGGPVHAKYRRMIQVYVDITAPLYWWKEFDTYKVGTVANSCSTMHKIHDKAFDVSDFSYEHIIVDRVETENGACEPFAILSDLIATLNVCRENFIDTQDKRFWWQMIQLLPSSYNQKRTVMLNYEVLVGIFKDRKHHKLDEWRELCNWIAELPYHELITGDE